MTCSGRIAAKMERKPLSPSSHKPKNLTKDRRVCSKNDTATFCRLYLTMAKHNPTHLSLLKCD